LRRRLRHSHIDVDLSSFPAEQTGPPSENRQHYHNHEDHQYGNYAGTAATATVVSHLNAPLKEAMRIILFKGGWKKKRVNYTFLAYAYGKGQRVIK